ncbi:hypothetical protein OIN60_05800 [Paenibacillus sp. P96]|uniref:AAA+ ATPase domain-containing protein n=1 Tax=Paenibacillus zeirhizosphaerae TaxID=2987519 RepID=A0ABT9FNI9_9BACL|nr:hypothetical protein [Paenibacillus sp. P96]MDP4096283.1 hypothetical protein [Paenibacillus sp. P96]
MKKYRSSIHMQFDLPDPHLLDRYVLTLSHSKVLNGVLEGVSGQGDKHSHLLIGPYGTGKSLVSTIICQLLSRQFSHEWSMNLQGQAERIDTQLAHMLRRMNGSPVTYIPVLISGKTGNISKIINQAIHRALHQAGLHIVTPNEALAILSTVDRWKQSYSEAYNAFLHFLQERPIEEAEWRKQIEACHEELTQQFINFYPSVTAGTSWSYNHEASFIEELESVSKELEARQLGLFIVYDEFGWFLQTLDDVNSTPNMRDLQALAEFADRANNVHLLLVSHKHIRQYATNSRESIRLEFEKIEGRFRHYTLENDAGTYLHLAQEALRDINGANLGGTADFETADSLRGFPLFGDFTSYQLEQGLLTTLYPVHPVAVMLLPQLSNIYGQNERTLYSFLSDHERDSLREHIQQHDGYYYADRLFRFFRLDTADIKEQSALELYHAVIPYIDGESLMQKRIVELLTMWAETRLTQKQPVTIPFLAFALGIEDVAVENELNRLVEAKIVRYNSVRGQWELFNGSSINIEDLIAEKLTSSSLTTREGMDILERHLPLSFILPYDYNDEMDMLRYADIRFADIAEMKASQEKEWPGDDRIWFVAYEDQDRKDDPDAVMQELGRSFLVAFPSFSMETVLPYVLKFKITEHLLNDTVLLALDSRLKNELLFIQEETSLMIQAFVDRYFEFAKLEWRSGTERVMVRDLHVLERRLSDRLLHKYPHTPVIRNEAFNRNRISAIQRRAVTDVIDRLIQDPSEPALGIDGHGPNYLIYATTLKNNDYHIDRDGVVNCNGTLEAIRQGLMQQLYRKPIGKLSELIGMMREAPYGIRSSVVPLLFVALLRDRWEQLLFYSHDMMISHLSGVSILEMVELADSFEYRYYDWSVEERNQLLEAGRRLELPDEACNSFIQASESLLQWLRQLPKFAQISQQLSPETLRIRDRIRSTEVDPYTYMKELVIDLDSLAEAKEEMEHFMQHNERELAQRILALTGQHSFVRFFEIFNQSREEAIEKNSKLMTLPVTEDLTGIIDRMAEHLVGVARADWSDSTQELFLSQVKYEWELFRAGSEVAAVVDMTVDVNQPLSKKTQTLYINVKNMLKYAGRDVSTQEIKQLLAKLIYEL